MFEHLRPPGDAAPPPGTRQRAVERGRQLRRRHHVAGSLAGVLAAAAAIAGFSLLVPDGGDIGVVHIEPALPSPSTPTTTPTLTPSPSTRRGRSVAPTPTGSPTVTGAPTPTGAATSTGPAPTTQPTTGRTGTPGGAVTSPAAPSPSTSSTPVACATSQLRLTVNTGAYSAGLGHYGVALVLTNTSRTSCTVEGYPGVELQDAQGKPIAEAARGDDYLFPDPHRRALTLRPGDSASAGLGLTASGKAPDVAAVRLTPPDQRVSLSAGLDMLNPFAGTVHVSALVPGTRGPQS